MDGRMDIRRSSKITTLTKSYKGPKVGESHDHSNPEGTWNIELKKNVYGLDSTAIFSCFPNWKFQL